MGLFDRWRQRPGSVSPEGKCEVREAAAARFAAKRNDSLAIFEQVLRDAGLEAARDGDGISSAIGMRGARRPSDAPDVLGAACALRIAVDAESSAVSCWATLLDPVPIDRRGAVAEASMRISRESMFGSWDLDLDTGIICLRVWLHVADGALSPRVAEGLLSSIHEGARSAALALHAVAFDGADPRAAAATA